MKQWKGVKMDMSKNPNAPIALYNVDEDIEEKNDIASQHPDIVMQIERIMKEEHLPSELFQFQFEKNNTDN